MRLHIGEFAISIRRLRDTLSAFSAPSVPSVMPVGFTKPAISGPDTHNLLESSVSSSPSSVVSPFFGMSSSRSTTLLKLTVFMDERFEFPGSHVSPATRLPDSCETIVYRNDQLGQILVTTVAVLVFGVKCPGNRVFPNFRGVVDRCHRSAGTCKASQKQSASSATRVLN